MKELNEKLFTYINGYNHQTLDVIMRFAGSYWVLLFTLMLTGYCSFSYFKKIEPDRSFRLSLLFTTGTSMLCLLGIVAVKYFFGNIFQLPPNSANAPPATNTFGAISQFPLRTFIISYFATLLIFIFDAKYRGIGIMLIIVAIIVSYSRIYTGVHYPLSVALSGFFGSLFAFLLYRIDSSATATIKDYEHERLSNEP